MVSRSPVGRILLVGEHITLVGGQSIFIFFYYFYNIFSRGARGTSVDGWAERFCGGRHKPPCRLRAWSVGTLCVKLAHSVYAESGGEINFVEHVEQQLNRGQTYDPLNDSEYAECFNYVLRVSLQIKSCTVRCCFCQSCSEKACLSGSH